MDYSFPLFPAGPARSIGRSFSPGEASHARTRANTRAHARAYKLARVYTKGKERSSEPIDKLTARRKFLNVEQHGPVPSYLRSINLRSAAARHSLTVKFTSGPRSKVSSKDLFANPIGDEGGGGGRWTRGPRRKRRYGRNDLQVVENAPSMIYCIIGHLSAGSVCESRRVCASRRLRGKLAGAVCTQATAP